MSTANEAATAAWHLCTGIYPSAEEIVVALQDLGKGKVVKQKKRDVQQHKYPLIEKLATKLYTGIQKEFNNPDGLTKNVTRGKQPLIREIIMARRHVDVSETHPFFHQHGRDGKVYLIANSPGHCGLDIAVKRFQDSIIQAMKQKNSARTYNDGIRLGCILLDSKYRGTVSGIMTKKKDRKKSDISGDPINHFFEEALTECFSNPEYLATPPAECYYNEIPEDERANWDPNHISLFEQDRNAGWLRGTWEEYIRPKYKKALDKWNKDTGGGDGTPASFIDFCGSDRWLVWIFCKDLEANFLLANNAGGRMPKHLQVESGFAEDVSSLSGGSTARRNAIEEEVTATKKQRERIGSALEKVASWIENKGKAHDMDSCISKVADYSKKMRDSSILETMSPESRDLYVRTIKKQRKEILKKMADEEESGNSSGNN